MHQQAPSAPQPPPGSRSVETVLALLREHGGRATQPRRLLLAVLMEPGHHTADQIAVAVRRQAPDLAITTVYRNLDELERLHVIDRTYVSHRPATYHLASSAHGHLACESCGTIAELPGDAFRALSDAAMAAHGFAISLSRFAVPGMCGDCRAQRPGRSQPEDLPS